MLTLTKRAIAEIQDILVVHGASPECGARLLVTPGDRIRWVGDSPRASDQTVVQDSATLVLLDAEVAARLGAIEIDLNVAPATRTNASCCCGANRFSASN